MDLVSNTSWFFLVCVILLAGIIFWFGFIRRETSPIAFIIPGFRNSLRSQAITSLLVILFVVLPILVFSIWREASSRSEVSKYITVYPNLKKATWYPVELVSEGDEKKPERYWMFKTDDSPEKVIEFYLNEDNLDGWVFTTEKPKPRERAILGLKRGNMCLTI